MIARVVRRGWILFSFAIASIIALLAPTGNIYAASQSTVISRGQFPYSGSAKCPSPPTGWNPATATVAELRFYGLPLPHASSGPSYEQWLDQMHHSVTRLWVTRLKAPTTLNLIRAPAMVIIGLDMEHH